MSSAAIFRYREKARHAWQRPNNKRAYCASIKEVHRFWWGVEAHHSKAWRDGAERLLSFADKNY